MKSSTSYTLKFLFALSLLFCIKTGSAQTQYELIGIRIDSLASIGLPQSALKAVDQLDSLARKNNNAPQQIRAVIYRMTFQSYLEENALVAIVNRLKTDLDKAAYPVKPVLQSLLAQMYWNYYQQNRYRFSQRSQIQQADSDFTNWDLQTIINQTSSLYQLSLKDAEKEQHTPVAILNGVLEGDTSTRYLRPTLYDLLVNRAFDFFLSDEPALTKPKLPFTLDNPAFFGDSRTFATLQVNSTDTASTYYRGIKYLQQATAFHLKNQDEEAAADLDLQRLKFLFGKSYTEHKDSLYLAALSQIAVHFSSKPISSEALVLQGQYYQGLDSLTIAYSYFKKAMTAYPQSMGGKNGATLIKQLEEKEISATTENTNMPGKPILALLKIKNITSAKFAVYRLSEKQLKDYLDIYNSYNSDLVRSKFRMSFLNKLSPVQTKEFKWAAANDYKSHSLEFKIDALAPGNYILMVKDAATDDEKLTGLSNFQISSLAYTARVNPDKVEVRVMDRETGKPLNGVHINLKSSFSTYNSTLRKNELTNINENGLSNKDGLYYSTQLSSGNNVAVSLTAHGDTLTDQQRYINGARDNSDDDDDPQDKTVLFTDRQIYRPGQTIYFKALQLQTLKGKSKIMPGKNIEVNFMDVNGKQVSSLKLKTNDFGTVSGNFIVPQTMLSGDVELKTENGEIEVKVEEYKRPTFQVEFSPVKESHKLNDTVIVRGNVTAFSGYGLSQARVAYHIVRSQNRVFRSVRYGVALYNSRYNNFNQGVAEIKADTITADDQGKFEIKFKAVPGETNDQANTNYSYAINADVTDASGETHSAETSVTVGNNDIRIDNYLPELLFAKDSISTAINIVNLNGQPLKANLKFEVYALKNSGQVYKNRFWQVPDQFITKKDAFKNDFPFYAYNNEDQVSAWPAGSKIIDINIKTNGEKQDTINLQLLKKQAAGMYRVVISARNEKGDTTSAVKYVNLINEVAKPVKFDDWVVVVKNTVKPGEDTEFLVGLNQKISVLMERYNGAKLISSKWITIDKGMQDIKVPVSDTDKNAAVQFLMLYQNRLYNSYQKIYIANPDQGLKIKFLTFHNKLQPGEKEQWKLQVTNSANEKQSAEMLAGLHDASLDDITPAQSWTNFLYQEPGYQPNYFDWTSYNFVNAVNTELVNSMRENFSLQMHDYEKLNLFGYNYYGGFNGNYQAYLQRNKTRISAALRDQQLQADYFKNAARVKNGYDITGRVIDEKEKFGIPGVTVNIKGMSIGTQTNSAGYFRLKVPVNATLTFKFIGYEGKEVKTTKSDNVSISLKESANALNEVVVVGYGAQERMSLSAAVTTIQLRGNRAPVAALEGKAAGVAVTKAKGLPGAADKIFIRGVSEVAKPKPIVIRKNFNETAFFYPELQTDEKGEILINFTIPEALTRWKFRGLALSKDLKSGYIENTVVTQKQLSISANTPRFLREGDTITISARLANLTGGILKGKVQMQLFNALNMQPVSLFVNNADAGQSFEITGGTTKAVSFRLAIPAGLDALTYRLTAESEKYSDGEENTMPVLPNRTLVTESMPMMVRAGQTRKFTFNKLVNQNSTTLKNKTLTLEYTQNPAWYAVQALPYLMEFPYECSEQVFSRYYANSLASSPVKKLPAIKQVFDQWKTSNSTELLSNLEKNQELKETLIEETPWLKDAESESEQKKRIALLFDLNKMSDELQLNLDKLSKRQLPNGGFTWFGGDRADRYITQHIAEGMGELYHLGIADKALDPIAGNATRYLDDQLTNDERISKQNSGFTTRSLNDLEIHAWFTRSYFLDKPMSKELKAAFTSYLNRAASQWTLRNVYEQGLIALTMSRYKKPAVTAQIEKSLLETAQHSDELGMYWAKNRLGYFWYESPVETQSLMIELFTEAGDNTKAVEEMKIWLLRNKQTNDWKTTKATAAACYALLLKGGDLLADKGSSIIKLDEKQLEELKPDVKADAGTGYIKTSWADEQIKPALGNVEIQNNGKTIAWGAMHWQYLENLDKITSSQTNISVQRKYFIQKQTDAGPVLTAVDDTHLPKTGDLLKVVVHLKADRDFEYVQLKDLRPAGTEPVDAISTYKFQDGLYYYQVTKDVATNFFISYLNKGNYVFEYQLRVAQPGNFSTGISSVQCMYAPEFNAHSEGSRMMIKP